jgi:hypothetical protein
MSQTTRRSQMSLILMNRFMGELIRVHSQPTKHLFPDVTGAGVYVISTPDGVYVGRSSNIRKRWNEHLSCLRLNDHPSKRLQRAYAAHSVESLGLGKVSDNLEDEAEIARSFGNRLLNARTFEPHKSNLTDDELLLECQRRGLTDRRGRTLLRCAKTGRFVPDEAEDPNAPEAPNDTDEG